MQLIQIKILQGYCFHSMHTIFWFLMFLECAKIAQTQTTSETPKANQSFVPHQGPRSNFSHVNLSMCDGEANSNASNSYCKCSESVINCDFANATSKQPVMVHLSARNINESIQRICVCNTKRNIYIALKKEFLPVHGRIHRIDFYNLNAAIDFADSSYLTFGGDLYMSKIKYLNKIGNLQFGRQDFEVKDVQDLHCCSEISTTSPFGRPTLYIENTTIGQIRTNGIYPNHLWKTVILRFVRIQNGMERMAMRLQDGVNVSISNSFFNNLSDRAIVADDIHNFIMIKSSFNHSCHPLAFGAKSKHSNSSIMLIGNRFLNMPQLHLEAKEIVNWFNFYDSWNNDTFVIPNSTTTAHKERVLSVEFNTVDEFSLQPKDFPELGDDENVTFNDNILSICNCSSLKNNALPSLLKTYNQRCEAHFASEGNSKCTLNIRNFADKCQSNSNPNVDKLCQDKSTALPLVHSSKHSDLEFKAHGLTFDSPFALRMIREHETECLYRMQKVVQYSKLYTYTEEEFEANDSIEYFEECSNKTDNEMKRDASSSTKTNSGMQAKTVVLIVFSVILTFVGGLCIIYLLRKKFLLGSPGRYMSLNTY